MKIPLSWLREYVDIDATAEEIADKLTFSGTEVEGIHRIGGGLDDLVVGEILSVEAHPNADRLRVCKVGAGDEPIPVVCGASNFQVGDKAAFAPVGATLPGGMRIKKTKIRGEVSLGMLCAADELGLSDDHEGILLVDGGHAAGTPLTEVLPPPEIVLELEVTWNRPDCLSVIGMAREVAALFGKPLKQPDVLPEGAGGDAPESVSVVIDDPAGCPRYTARVVEGVSIGPSPLWMQQRLSHCGIRPINNVVDITNYVLLECGQPLHAFDLDLLKGPAIRVRRARDGETLTTLDDIERKLSAQMLVIDESGDAVALAGVMGGGGERDQ